MSNGLQTFVFNFHIRQNGVVNTKTEEKDCTDWTEAHLHFVTRCRDLGIRGEGLSACSFCRKDSPEGACCFGGMTMKDTLL
jgi:hypothetical protein